MHIVIKDIQNNKPVCIPWHAVHYMIEHDEHPFDGPHTEIRLHGGGLFKVEDSFDMILGQLAKICYWEVRNG